MVNGCSVEREEGEEGIPPPSLSSISGSLYAQHRRRAEPGLQRSGWKSVGTHGRSTMPLIETGIESSVRRSSAHSWRSVVTHGQSSATQLSETRVGASVRRGSAHRRREARRSAAAGGRISRLLWATLMSFDTAAKCSDGTETAANRVFVSLSRSPSLWRTVPPRQV